MWRAEGVGQVERHDNGPRMQRIVVVGGGFAGLWSAMAAARVLDDADAGASSVEVVLVSRTPELVIRPRLYEPNPASKRVPLDSVLGPLGVRRIEGDVVGVSPGENIVWVNVEGSKFSITYSRLVLATGSQLHRPDLPGLHEHAHSVDTLEDAVELERHVADLPSRESPEQFSAAVIGAGFTGLEVATELLGTLRALSDGRAQVTLIERAEVIGPDLGPGPRPVIEQALVELGVSYRLGVSPTSITAEGVTLDTGETVPAATTVWTAGLRASSLTELFPVKRDHIGRLPVDACLQVEGLEDIFAAGDVAAALADDEHPVLMSCQHAITLGKFAGHNAAASLVGQPTVAYAQPHYVTCLDLGAWGAVYCEGWDRKVVLTRGEAKDVKRKINGKWIYPPRSGQLDELLKVGDIAATVS